MRFCLPVCLLTLLPGLLHAQEKRRKGEALIKIVELKRSEPVEYARDIEPIFYKKCISCHSGTVKEAKFDLGSYEGLIKGGKRGQDVIPGNSAKSLLYQQASKTQKPYMPPRSEEPLLPEELALIKLWIDQGAKAPTGVRVKPKVILTTLPSSVHPIRAIGVSPDKAVVAAGRGNQIYLFDAKTGNVLLTLLDPSLVTGDKKPVKAAHLAIVESMAFAPDGKLLATGGFQEVKIWDVATGALKQTLTGFGDRVMALGFSPDGKLLATGGGPPSEDGEVKLFDTAGWKQVLDLKNGHSDTVYGLSFSPDGKLLATCAADKFIKVWEVPSGKFQKSFEGHTHHVLDVGWKFDGKMLASAGADNVVKIWDYAKGEQTRTINAHTKQVTRLLFIGKTPTFVTCSGDGSIKFWNVDNGGNQRNFGGNNDFIYAIGVSPDGALLAAGGEEGVIRLYNGANGQMLKTLVAPGEEPKAAKK